MIKTKEEALTFVYENDVKFIRLQFCDMFGKLKNISIQPGQLKYAFEFGKILDTSFFEGFPGETDNLLIFPDPSTLCVLPWRPQSGKVVRFFCNIMRSDGTPFEGDCRALLMSTIDEAKKNGYKVKVDTKCEFYLFKTDENGMPIAVPHDEATAYDVAPLDKGENVRREICLTLEEMGFTVKSSHHESGSGQHLIVFKYNNALETADNVVTFKTVVKTIAGRNGLYASFMPKPFTNKPGNALLIGLDVLKDGTSLFGAENIKDTEAESFTAGILNHIKGMSLFLNPIVNSYKRFGGLYNANDNISWSARTGSKLIRLHTADRSDVHLEVRSADPVCNPYLALSLMIKAGFDGIEKGLKLPDENKKVGVLPSCLLLALNAAKRDKFVKDSISDYIFDRYVSAKNDEWQLYEKTVNDFDIKYYFNQE